MQITINNTQGKNTKQASHKSIFLNKNTESLVQRDGCKLGKNLIHYTNLHSVILKYNVRVTKSHLNFFFQSFPHS